MSHENSLWEASPSQVVNLKSFFTAGMVMLIPVVLVLYGPDWVFFNLGVSDSPIGVYIIFSTLIISTLILLFHWLNVHCTVYYLTTERLFIKTGIFNKKTDVTELYRIRDYINEEPLIMRIFSLGNIIMETSDNSHPIIVLSGIADCESLMELLRTYVEACRISKGVREIDVRP